MLALAVAIVGVPHGGLDHLTGRRLLAARFPRTWALVFFPAYLAVALVVVIGWNVVPLLTALGFFLISAWHFGLEDDHGEFSSKLVRGVVVTSIGGMVIWIPVLTQASQVQSLLMSILPSEFAASAAEIVETTAWIAMVMLPIAAVVIARDFASATSRGRAIRNISFAGMFATADVLLSFGIYFCGWHSIRGLWRLAQENGMSLSQVVRSAMPLSIGAVSLAAIGMWFWSSGQTPSDAITRTLFISLSSMAVPHLLLHGPFSEITVRSRITMPQKNPLAFEPPGVTS